MQEAFAIIWQRLAVVANGACHWLPLHHCFASVAAVFAAAAAAASYAFPPTASMPRLYSRFQRNFTSPCIFAHGDRR